MELAVFSPITMIFFGVYFFGFAIAFGACWPYKDDSGAEGARMKMIVKVSEWGLAIGAVAVLLAAVFHNAVISFDWLYDCGRKIKEFASDINFKPKWLSKYSTWDLTLVVIKYTFIIHFAFAVTCLLFNTVSVRLLRSRSIALFSIRSKRFIKLLLFAKMYVKHCAWQIPTLFVFSVPTLAMWYTVLFEGWGTSEDSSWFLGGLIIFLYGGITNLIGMKVMEAGYKVVGISLIVIGVTAVSLLIFGILYWLWYWIFGGALLELFDGFWSVAWLLVTVCTMIYVLSIFFMRR